VKTIAVSLFIIVLLGIALFFSDGPLLNHFDWSQTDASYMVVQYRHTVILVQVLLLALIYVKAQKPPEEKKTGRVLVFAVVVGFVFSALGWIKIDSLLHHQSMIGC